MSDCDNDKNISSEEDEERYSALPAGKNSLRSSVLLRQRRQRFCPKWQRDFPWLKPDNVDESIGICTACNKRLVCKKSHLERHQKTYKHQRAVGFDDMPFGDNYVADSSAATSTTAPEFLECGKLEPADEKDEFENAIEVDPEFSDSCDFKAEGCFEKEKLMTHTKHNHHLISKSIAKKPKPKFDRIQLLKRIDRDRQELNDCYHAHRQQRSSPTSQIKYATSSLPRDTFDLFFDSVSASVKTLPPKLAAEVKIRVSQIVAEYELRAICEREANLESASTNFIEDRPTLVVASAADVEYAVAKDVRLEDINTKDGGGRSFTRILYSFQPKTNK